MALAADKVNELAQSYALDLTRVMAMGHSAGGHLAHWLAARTKLNPGQELYRAAPLRLKGFISIAGIPDLAEAIKKNICQEAPLALMGALKSELPERYTQGSPADMGSLSLKQVFIQGIQDSIVPLTYIEAYVDARRLAGDIIDLIKIDQCGHFEPVIATTRAWQEVEKAPHSSAQLAVIVRFFCDISH
ncbi:MAG: hypothetical protein R2865_03380 [Deinococcales bacterium]